MSIRASLPPPPFFLFFFLVPLSNILYLSSHAKYTRTLGITSLLLIYFEYIPQRPARPGGGRARGRGQRGGGGHGHGAAVLVRARGHRVAAARLLARAARVAGLRVPAGADHAQHALPDTHRAAGTLGRRPLIVRSLTTRSLTCFSVQLKTILIFFVQGVIREGLSSLSASGAAMSWCRAQAQQGGAANHAPHEPLFQLTYEKKPFGVNCDYKLVIP